MKNKKVIIFIVFILLVSIVITIHFFSINTNNISIDEVKETALTLAKANSNAIFSSVSNSKDLQGECYLEYDENGTLYYTVLMNHGSYVKIDAVTGKIISTYFFDGIYY